MRKPRFKYVSVTEVLDAYTDFSMVPKATLEAAKVRGTAVHDFSAGYVQYGMLFNVPLIYQGYVDSFRGWFDKEVDQVLACEERIFNDALLVCGQLDLCVTLKKFPDNIPIIVDIKTPAIYYKTWRAQVAAYKYLYELEYATQTGVPASLQLDKDGGEATFAPVDDHTVALKFWIKALECYHYFS